MAQGGDMHGLIIIADERTTIEEEKGG